ncbi:LysR family transcriptional regulator [Novosphingobium sp. 1949]|uniref:LysR family transcriptional regulator n=1 Tax=Novosphingobium organovorum TaxID=2930092 RepID=A0ABT0BDW7_9SPHN|nr:LysR family transcriptional regulator [Novosphingobium organovorum]MCJ2183261.1 LysR family transcriptional regulator [Novosphingobium organovorum]
MSLLHLRSFVEVYRQRSFSAAARVLGLTQPAISQHITALEAGIGHPLFDRQAKGVVPTAIATELAAGLGDRLDVAEAALAQVRARSSDLTGVVRIMSHGDFLAELVMPRLRPLLARGMRLRLLNGGREEIRTALLEGECDLAISGYPVTDQRLRSEKVHAELLHAVAAPEVAARLNAAPDLGAALETEPVLAFDLEQQLVDDWLGANALTCAALRPALICEDLRGLRAIVMQGFGWSVLPDYLCVAQLAHGELVEIRAPIAPPANRYFLVASPTALREPRVVVARNAIRAMLTTD